MNRSRSGRGRIVLLLLGALVLTLPAMAFGTGAVGNPAAAATTVTVVASQDGYVRSDQPDTNFGTKYVLDSQAGSATTPTQISFVTFSVSGLSAAPAGVTLQLYTYATSTTGLQFWTTPSTWTETGLTYNNAPTLSSTMVGAIPSISSNTWASLDLSRVITGNGTYSFAITTTSTANKQSASRESSATPPRLSIQVANPAAAVAATSGAAQSAAVGTAFAQPLVATVTDAGGAGVPNAQVTFSAPVSGATGTFDGGAGAVSVTTDANGVATSPVFTAGSLAGAYSVIASATSTTATASFGLTNTTTTTPTTVPPTTVPPTTVPPTTVPPTTVPPTTVTTSASASSSSTASTTSIALSADAYVRSDQPDTNFGKAYNLAAEAGSATTPTITSYLSVSVAGLTGTVASASLQLYSYATSAQGISVATTAGGWTETGITYNNAPAVGPVVGSGPNIVLNTWASIDVSTTVTGNGTYNFAVTTTRTANNQFGSRESGNAPKLVITTTSATPTPSATTTTPAPTTTSASPTTTITPGAALTATAGSGQSVMIGGSFATALTATLIASDGSPAGGSAVTFTAPTTGASATFPGGASTITLNTAADGTVTTPPLTAGATAGTYSVTAATNGGAQSTVFTLTNTDPTIVAAGDIACSQGSAVSATSCQQIATSNLAISLKPDYVLPLGDDQYELGSLADYQAMYDPSWGRLNSIAYPVPGNHEYGYIGSSIQPTGGTGYFTYFGDRSHPLQPGCTTLCTSWYSYSIGTWHIIALDSQCAVIGGCNPGNPEYAWLQNDLKTHPATCTLAYWHIPIYASSLDRQPDMQAIFSLLYSKGADVVLNGHAHYYERFAPQDGAKNLDPTTGVAEFVVGSGGRSFFSISATPQPNSLVRIANTFGVLQMTLSAGSYSWRFVPAGGTATDSGSAACH